jgi:hypothetical protein
VEISNSIFGVTVKLYDLTPDKAAANKAKLERMGI